MNHLSPAEFADAAEDALAPARASHLASCAACREQAAGVAAALAAARDVEVPEPSPLYWPHMAARIRERVGGETIVPAWRAGSWWPRFVPVASAAALVVAAVVAVVTLSPRGADVVSPDVPAAVAGAVAEAVHSDDSEAWQMLTSAAEETPIEDAHAAGMAVPSGAVERAVQRMSPEELDALDQLLRREMRRAGA